MGKTTKRINLTIQELFGYNPSVYQREVHKFRKMQPYTTLVAHRRFGKTELGLMELLQGALMCQRRLPIFDYIAPTLKQAKNIAWEKMQYFAETARQNGMTNIKISKTDTNIKISRGGDIGIATISLAGWEEPESLRGPYCDGMIIDEAADQKPGVWGKILAPKLADRHGWALITGTVKGLDQFYDFYSKGVDGPDKEEFWGSMYYPVDLTRGNIPWLDVYALDSLRSGMTDIEWDQEMNCNWTASSENILIPLKVIEKAVARNLREDDWLNSPHILGVDVAGSGSDPFCIARRWGPWFAGTTKIKNPDVNILANIIIGMVNRYEIDAVFVDGTGGYAGALMTAIRNMGIKCPIYEIGFKSRAVDEIHYANIRAEMWDKMRDYIDRSAGLPNDINLKRELSCPVYKYNNSRLQLESKDDIRKKLGHSPDEADAYALTFAYKVTPLNLQNHKSGVINRSKVVKDNFEL